MPNKKGKNQYTSLQELEREHRLLLKLDLKRPQNYRMAEKLWEEARRNAHTGEVVTSWAGVVS